MDIIPILFGQAWKSKMKNIVLTGATSGIGREVARELLKKGHTVITNFRNMEKSEKVRDELAKLTGNQNFVLLKADFEDFSSVNEFASEITSRFESIEVLINNAGTWETAFKETKNGFETNLQVNHLSPMLLTLKLIPLLKKSGSSRIINTSSGAHRRDILNLPDLEFRHSVYNGIATYSQSKLLNILFSLELAGRLHDTRITVNTVHPGYVKTSLFDKMGDRNWSGVPDAALGAQSAVYAALSQEMEGISGRYIYLDKEDPNISELAKNEEIARKAWEKSTQLIGKYLEVEDIKI